MVAVKWLVLGYVLCTHVLLHITSPPYRHEVVRVLQALTDIPAAWQQQLSVLKGQQLQPAVAKSGVYASSDLLHSLQQHMRPQGKPQNTSGSSMYSTSSTNLIAYMSATDVLAGEGWKARGAFFMFLLAPRYVMASSGGIFLPEFNLLYLASNDLPAVGLLNRSQDPSVGYQLSCNSPALSMGLGPQPFARCSVWLSDAETLEDIQPRTRRIARASAAAAAARARLQPPSTTNSSSSNNSDGGGSGDDGQSDSSSTSTRSGGGVADVSPADTCNVERVVATWTILPDSTPEGVAQQLKEIGAEPQTYLAGNRFKANSGWLSTFLDVWLFFPRAFLLQLLPAMMGVQQLLYGAAVLLFSWHDLVQLVHTVQKLQAQAMDRTPFWGVRGWDFAMLGLSVVVQLLLMTCVRAALAGWATYVAVHLLLLVARGVEVTAAATQLPFMHIVGSLLDVKGSAKAAAAAVLTFLAVIRMQDVCFLLLTVCIFVLLTGLIFDHLERNTNWTEQAAALTSVGFACFVSLVLDYGYCCFVLPAMVLPAGAASSRSWLVRLAAKATAAAQPSRAGTAAAASAAAAATATASAAAGSSVQSSKAAAMHATAAAVRGALLPWQGVLMLVHSVCEDAVMLTVALLVWEGMAPTADWVWAAAVDVAADVGVVLECLGSCVYMLLGGVSWRFVWNRFWAQVQLRLQQQQQAAAAGAMHGGMQAQVVIHAHQAAFANVNHTADALRALADELENMDDAAHQNQPMFNGRLILPRQPRGPRLGQHWPAPLEINVDLDDVRDELGLEVPRGMTCPLTLDIMKQPALLISSNIAVPSTYEKEAISRWLQDSRRDPKSRQTLAPDAQLVPNFDLYRSIEDWVAHAQALHIKHRQQQAAAAAAAAAAGEGLAQQQPSAAAAAAQEAAGAGPSSTAGAAAAAAASGGGGGRGGPAAGATPATSAATISSLLAAARGAVARGTAAAATAAAAAAAAAGAAGNANRRRRAGAAPNRARQQHQMQRRVAPQTPRTAPLPAAAGGTLDQLLSDVDEEDEGGGEGGDGYSSDGSDGYDADEHMLSEDAEEDLDAVHSHPGSGGAAQAAAAAAARSSRDASPQQQQSQGQAGASGGRYNLRQRRSVSGGAGGVV